MGAGYQAVNSPFISLALIASVAVAAEPVSFQREIAPIFQQRCVACHGEEKTKGGYRLDTFEWLEKAGDSGEPAKSSLHRLITTPDADERMPQKADALPAAEIATIERWIAEGARFDGALPTQTLAELTRSQFLRPAPKTYPRPVPVTALTFNGDGKTLAVGGYHEVLFFRAESGELARRVGGLPERIIAMAWSAKNDMLAVAGGTPGRWGTVALIEPSQRYAVRILCDLPEQALSVAISRDGTQLVAGCGDRTVRFFELPSGKQTRVLRLHADWVQSVAFNPGGTLLVSASRDRTARLLDPASGEVETTYRAHDTAMLAAVFSADGSRVFSTARGGAAHVWHPEKADKRGGFSEFSGEVEKLASSPLGIAAGGSDGIIRLYQLNDALPFMTFAGHTAPVQALAMSRNGASIASGSADGEVIIWNPACGTWVRRFPAQP